MRTRYTLQHVYQAAGGYLSEVTGYDVRPGARAAGRQAALLTAALVALVARVLEEWAARLLEAVAARLPEPAGVPSLPGARFPLGEGPCGLVRVHPLLSGPGARVTQEREAAYRAEGAPAAPPLSGRAAAHIRAAWVAAAAEREAAYRAAPPAPDSEPLDSPGTIWDTAAASVEPTEEPWRTVRGEVPAAPAPLCPACAGPGGSEESGFVCGPCRDSWMAYVASVRAPVAAPVPMPSAARDTSRPAAPAEDPWDRAVQLRAAGTPTRKIARETGLPESTIRTRFKREGL
jgi:hypothetical protein